MKIQHPIKHMVTKFIYDMFKEMLITLKYGSEQLQRLKLPPKHALEKITDQNLNMESLRNDIALEM